MNQSIEIQITKCEEQLTNAMLESDIQVLDSLISEDLLFSNHLGQLMTKQDDLEAHKSGLLNIEEISHSNQIIKYYGNTAIVSVKATILGTFSGYRSKNEFRFTRIWYNYSNTTWQIIAGHSSIVT